MVFMALSMSSILQGDLNKYLKCVCIIYKKKKMRILVCSTGKFFCCQIGD